jgi:nitrite reductase/ring-hydroxylating ferredoxin subunit
MSDSPSASCSAECSGRRAFLRDAIASAVALAGLASLPPRALAALEVTPAGTVRYPLPTADSVSIDNDNEVILCRSKGMVFAFALSCPHQNTALRALPGNKGFQCARHKSKYLPDGTFVNGKATRNMDRLPITLAGAEVVVDIAVAYESDTQPDKWGAAFVRVS